MTATISMVFAAIGGAILGSFANVCIDRLPMRGSLRGRSQCDRCRRTLRWWELLPVISAMMLRHHCPRCGGGFAVRNTLVELGCAALLVGVTWGAGARPWQETVVLAFGLLVLLILACIDLERGVVPDVISIPVLVGIVLVRMGTAWQMSDGWVMHLGQVLLFGGVGAGWFWIQHRLSRGAWVGDGDIRVGALLGALFPGSLLAVALGAAYIVGGLIGGVLLATGLAQRKSRLPFVPFLFLGAVVAAMVGTSILEWYDFS